jgi:hypothetical protein
MLKKICRLCPNTLRWTRPTEKTGENKKAYTAKFGFGFEEWLNREEWVLSGYEGVEGEWRYVHIPGMLTPNNAYVGQEVSILFYIKESNKDALAVGYLEKGYVLDEKEATWAAKQFAKKNWLQLMHDEVKAIGGNIKGLPPIPDDTEQLTWDKPLYYANVRFSPGALHFFDERKIIQPKSYYYTGALQWDGVIPEKNYLAPAVSVPHTVINKSVETKKELDRFSEEIRTRRADSGKPFYPRQAPIQNALAKQLNNFLMPKNCKVTCEDERVDVKIIEPNGSKTFIEIKPATSAREAIRLALGQLLEYSHYPDTSKAALLVIVSDASPEQSDFVYLKNLKKIYNIPVRYVHWPLGAKKLPENELSNFLTIAI